jgi:hypothetical protein
VAASNENKKGIAHLALQLGQRVRQESRQDSTEQSRQEGGGEGGGPARIFSVLDYIEQSWGLNMRLFPAQRFLVKLYYHLPLEDKIPEDVHKRIKVTDKFGDKVLYTFSEKDYLKYLYSEGRCNIGEQDHERRELVLAIGRRAGKTTLSGIFASYEIYRLLNLYNPQEYFGLPNGNVIQLISVATGKEQAGLLFNEVTSHLAKCDYFKPFIASNTLSNVKFRTPYEIDKFGPLNRQENGKFVSFNGKASLRVSFNSCNGRGLRGFGNIVIILDEIAHFQNKGLSSGDEIYNAITPSSAAFSRKDPKTGLPLKNKDGEDSLESRIILISSPLGRSGKFYEKFDLAMRGGMGSNNILAIQAPTWEINPTVPSSYYREKFHEDPVAFMTEHGAQFSDQVRGWIERESDLQACINPTARPKLSARPRMPHQMGIDVGLVNDGTSVSITHVEEDRIVHDYHETWFAGVDWRETNPHLETHTVPYSRDLTSVERLDFDAIAELIVALSRKFHITSGLFDRWNGIPLEQALHKRGLRQFKSQFFTPDDRSKMFQTAKLFMYDKKLELYDFPIPEIAKQGATRHSALIAELLSLQAHQVSKNIVRVQAPEGAGYHDDMSDALVRAIWESAEVLLHQKYTSHGSVYHPHVSGSMTTNRYQLQRARQHGLGDRSLLGRRIMRVR